MCTRGRVAVDPLSPCAAVIPVRGAMRWTFFSCKNALPSQRKGVGSEQSVLDDLGNICVEELLPFGLGRVPQFFGV